MILVELLLNVVGVIFIKMFVGLKLIIGNLLLLKMLIFLILKVVVYLIVMVWFILESEDVLVRLMLVLFELIIMLFE